MKKFCGCNSKWVHGICFTPGGRSSQLTLSHMRTNNRPELCPKCQLYKWYNPQYENMMYDLKWMNS